MLGEKSIVLILLYWAFIQGTSATPTGNHTCFGVVKHPVTVRVNVTEPVTYRTYTWCLRVPPRCSKYTIQLRDRVKVQTEMHNKTITVCCKGYVEMDYKCVPACPPFNECPNMHCNRTNHCYCSPGYMGVYCNDLSVKAMGTCHRGFWGRDCQRPCDCPEEYTCHHLTGDCMLDDSPPKITKQITTTKTETNKSQDNLLKAQDKISEALKAATTESIMVIKRVTNVTLPTTDKISTHKIIKTTREIVLPSTTKITETTPTKSTTHLSSKSVTTESNEATKQESNTNNTTDSRSIIESLLDMKLITYPQSATWNQIPVSNHKTTEKTTIPPPLQNTNSIVTTATSRRLTTPKSITSTEIFTEKATKITFSEIPTTKQQIQPQINDDAVRSKIQNTASTIKSTMEELPIIKPTSAAELSVNKFTSTPLTMISKQKMSSFIETTEMPFLDIHSINIEKTFSVTLPTATNQIKTSLNNLLDRHLISKTYATEQTKFSPTETYKEFPTSKISPTTKSKAVTFSANMIENENDILQFINTNSPIKSRIENIQPTLRSESDENNALNLSQMLENIKGPTSKSHLNIMHTENQASTRQRATIGPVLLPVTLEKTSINFRKADENSDEHESQKKDNDLIKLKEQIETYNTVLATRPEKNENISNNAEYSEAELAKQAMGLLKTENLYAGVISQSNEEAVRHILSGLTFSLGCVTIITITVIMFLTFKRCKEKHKKCMMDEVILAYASASDSATNPLIYNSSNYSVYKIGDAQPTFFCPQFTNTYAEQLNRELRELNYDHPRATAEPLYAEIAN